MGLLWTLSFQEMSSPLSFSEHSTSLYDVVPGQLDESVSSVHDNAVTDRRPFVTSLGTHC